MTRLLEDGTARLLEDGSARLLEDGSVGPGESGGYSPQWGSRGLRRAYASRNLAR